MLFSFLGFIFLDVESCKLFFPLFPLISGCQESRHVLVVESCKKAFEMLQLGSLGSCYTSLTHVQVWSKQQGAKSMKIGTTSQLCGALFKLMASMEAVVKLFLLLRRVKPCPQPCTLEELRACSPPQDMPTFKEKCSQEWRELELWQRLVQHVLCTFQNMCVVVVMLVYVCNFHCVKESENGL